LHADFNLLKITTTRPLLQIDLYYLSLREKVKNTFGNLLAPIEVEILFVTRSGTKRLERKSGKWIKKIPEVLLQKK
jgi:hypothetical protein